MPEPLVLAVPDCGLTPVVLQLTVVLVTGVPAVLTNSALTVVGLPASSEPLGSPKVTSGFRTTCAVVPGSPASWTRSLSLSHQAWIVSVPGRPPVIAGTPAPAPDHGAAASTAVGLLAT